MGDGILCYLLGSEDLKSSGQKHLLPESTFPHRVSGFLSNAYLVGKRTKDGSCGQCCRQAPTKMLQKKVDLQVMRLVSVQVIHLTSLSH
jgi:hypothetical protein